MIAGSMKGPNILFSILIYLLGELKLVMCFAQKASLGGRVFAGVHLIAMYARQAKTKGTVIYLRCLSTSSLTI